MNGIPTKSESVVTVDLEELQASSISYDILKEAFGPSSLGILVVKGLPLEFVDLRKRLLSYASYLARLPPEVLETLTRSDAKFLVGWSHGKEALRSGHYDTLKGSYYVNCAFYQDPSLQSSPPDDRFPNFPEYTAPNVWPLESLIPGFRQTFEELCTLIIDVTVLVARACDRYAIAHIEDYESGYLEHVVKNSMTTKARLLHYFPPSPSSSNSPSSDTSDVSIENTEDDDSWCATHVDHGCLTGLTSALYIDETSLPPSIPSHLSTPSSHLPSLRSLPSSPDPSAGLYIRSRTGVTTKIDIPSDCLAFQTGEALEVITRGKFRAVPHFVKGPRPGGPGGERVARNTLAVFTQPNLGEVVDREEGTLFGEFARGVVRRHS